MRFADGSDQSGLNDLDRLAQAVFGRALIAHLRGHLVLGGDLFHHAGFIDVVRQRLLTIDVLAHLHRHDAGRRMRVIRSAHGHRVDVLIHLLQHFAKIVVFLGVREFASLRLQMMVVDIAQGDDVAVIAGLVGVTVPFASHSDAGDVDFFVGRFAVGQCKSPGHPEAHPRQGSLFQEIATAGFGFHKSPSNGNGAKRE